MSNLKEVRSKKNEIFTGMYPVTKTVQFGLLPVGATLSRINENGIIERDIQRVDDVNIVKSIMDRFYRQYIDIRLSVLCDNAEFTELLSKYFELYTSSDNSVKRNTEFDNVKSLLRDLISENFKSDRQLFNSFFHKEMFDVHLPEFVTDDNESEILGRFKGFTTYFNSFFLSRLNLFSNEEKACSIAYRLIHENLPRFIDNIISTKRIPEDIRIEFIGENTSLFDVGCFSKFLTQNGIDTYNEAIGNINMKINLYNQQNKTRYQSCKVLYKMMLSEERSGWKMEGFKSDEEMVSAIKEFSDALNNCFTKHGEHSLQGLLSNLSTFDLSGIYVNNDKCLTDLAQHVCGDYALFVSKIKDEIIATTKPTRKEQASQELYDKRISNLFKSFKSFSLSKLDAYCKETQTLSGYFSNLGKGTGSVDLFKDIELRRVKVEDCFNGKYGNIAQSDEATELVKDYMDAYKRLYDFVKPLCGNGDEANKDGLFYEHFEEQYEVLSDIIPLYNKVRNWLSRKPYTTDKVKLNFDNSILLDGWDENVEQEKGGVILRKDGDYYLGIINKNHKKIFMGDLPKDGECYEKMCYKLLSGAAKNCPRMFVKSSKYDPPKYILDIIEGESYKKTSKKTPFNINDLHKLIDYYKECILNYEKWQMYDFKFSDTSTYESINDFYKEVDEQGYKLTFKDVSCSYIDDLVEEGKLYLFKIYNKDYSDFSKGKKNLFTMYWDSIFANDNNKTYKLNGKAEVFYRMKSIADENIYRHVANKPIVNKIDANNKQVSTFKYDIVKNKRYTLDKFFLHCPLTINPNVDETLPGKFNENVRSYIRDNGFDHIIGIDRGERHLLYVSVIDMNGNIVEQKSLNSIETTYGKTTYDINYHDILDDREKRRMMQRKTWKSMDSIKDIKEGYMSAVVHVISEMMVKYNAVVVLEKLNSGFKNSRKKVEKSVYDKFENCLVEKLNYYVDKNTNANDVGGIFNGLQLVTKKTNSGDFNGNQNGCIFYVPAWCTSNIDPVTGFVNYFDTRYQNIQKTQLFFSDFQRITFNPDKNVFEFAFDYSKFTNKANETRRQWLLNTYGTRIRTFRNQNKNHNWDSVEIDLTNEFKLFFEKYGIDIYGNIKTQICDLSNAEFFKGLMYLVKLMLQMRNSITGQLTDYIISPAVDEKGNNFDSRLVGANVLPDNADANGAYNIARKGLVLYNKIQQANDTDGKSIQMTVTNTEWLNFAQKQ